VQNTATVIAYGREENGGLALSSSEIFNTTITGAAIAAAVDLGLMDELESSGEVSIPAFCRAHDLDIGCIVQIVRALTSCDIANLDTDTNIVQPGRSFQQVYADKGYFLWLVGGYGYALQHLAALSQNASTPADMDDRSFVKRDGRMVSAAAKQYGARYVDREFLAAIEPCKNEMIADLGCGSAARLIEIATRNPGVEGIGIDIDQNAIGLAQEMVRSAGVDDRIQVVCADIRKLEPEERFAPVTVLMSSFMGHDLWPKDRCLQVLENLQTCFPAVKRFLLCDTYRSDLIPSKQVPIFTLGFELLHAVMRQQVPTRSQWMELFAESSWECVSTRPIGIPYSVIFELRPRTATV